MLTASLVLSEVFIEHLLSTWRPPTLRHSHSNRKSWVTVTVIAILVVQADRAICLKPFRLALHPVSLNMDLVPSDSAKLAPVYIPLTASPGSSPGPLSRGCLCLSPGCSKSRLLSPPSCVECLSPARSTILGRLWSL